MLKRTRAALYGVSICILCKIRYLQFDSSSLVGKALEAFKVTSGSPENTIFRRKLATLRSFFPHDDDRAPADMAAVYHDLFELLRWVSRMRVYSAC